MEAISDGPVPELHTDSEEEEPKEAEEPIEPGDRIFAIGLVPAPAEIQATHFLYFYFYLHIFSLFFIFYVTLAFAYRAKVIHIKF